MRERRQPGFTMLLPDGEAYDPYRALWVAVLERWRADCFTANHRLTGARRVVDDQDHAWLNSAEVYPGSFAWICEVLNCDPDYVRQGVLRPPQQRGRRAIP